MRALVTGGAGLIGGHVVRRLLARGWEVRVLDVQRGRHGLEELAGVQWCLGDVRDRETVSRAVKGCDWVFHVAAIYALWMRDPERLWQVNVEGTRRVLEAAAEEGVKRVVHTSSIAVYGGQGKGCVATEESPFRLGQTGDLYAISKYAAHQVALSFARKGLDLVIVAPTGPIGPGDAGPTPTGRLLLMGLRMPFGLVTETTSNFGDVRDIAEGHCLAAERGKTGESYLLGAENWGARELQGLSFALMGRKRPVFSFQGRLLDVLSHALVGVSQTTGKAPLFTPAAIRIARLGLAADCRKAVRELGLPQNPIERALYDALIWFEKHGYTKKGAKLA